MVNVTYEFYNNFVCAHDRQPGYGSVELLVPL